MTKNTKILTQNNVSLTTEFYISKQKVYNFGLFQNLQC